MDIKGDHIWHEYFYLLRWCIEFIDNQTLLAGIKIKILASEEHKSMFEWTFWIIINYIGISNICVVHFRGKEMHLE